MKLLVCDVEGTIFKAKYRIEGTDFASTMWQPLAQRLGDPAIEEEKETHRKWDNNEYSSYLEWVEDTIRIHRKYGLHRDVFNTLIEEAEYNDGVRNFFANLDRTKYTPVLVSGGFQELVRRAQKELNIKYGFGACEYHFDESDGRLANHSLTPCDFDGKYDYVKTLFGVYKLKAHQDWVFVGDGKNDVHIAQKAPRSFGINAHPELAKVVSSVINSFDELHTHLHAEEEVIILTVGDLIDAEQGQSKKDKKRKLDVAGDVVPVEDYIKVKGQVKELSDRLNKSEQKNFKKESRSFNQITVLDSDYLDEPLIGLAELLDSYRVVFFGSRKERRLFQFLDGYHKNLTVISGVNEHFDTGPMEYADFIFTYHKCMGHTSSWKSEEAKAKVPFANLSRDNKEMIERAMANVLHRTFVFK